MDAVYKVHLTITGVACLLSLTAAVTVVAFALAGRLFVGGRFRTDEGPANLAVLDAETGERIAWARPDTPTVDRVAVEAAALLHDVDKLLPADDPASALPHGDGSAAWLARQGHPELGRLVAGHPVTRLLDGDAHRRWAAFASREERVVAYADKRAGQRLESMEARFASWRRRYPEGWDPVTWAAVEARARRLEADVCRAAAVRPDEVRRLPWTAAAFRGARREVAA